MSGDHQKNLFFLQRVLSQYRMCQTQSWAPGAVLCALEAATGVWSPRGETWHKVWHTLNQVFSHPPFTYTCLTCLLAPSLPKGNF